jgi:SAM-dependent methyltransferase
MPYTCRGEVKILDVGGGESKLAKTLAELGFSVTVIDIGEVDCGKAKHIKNNVLDYEFPEETFDIIISISTIEHVGLPCYGQTKLDQDGDIKVMDKIYRWLKPHGLAIITLPYGKPHHPPTFERVYSKETLSRRILSSLWQSVRIDYICNDEGWRTCLEPETLNRDACVLLFLQKRKH